MLKGVILYTTVILSVKCPKFYDLCVPYGRDLSRHAPDLGISPILRNFCLTLTKFSKLVLEASFSPSARLSEVDRKKKRQNSARVYILDCGGAQKVAAWREGGEKIAVFLTQKFHLSPGWPP